MDKPETPAEQQSRLTTAPLSRGMATERYALINGSFPPATLGMFALFDLGGNILMGRVLRALEDAGQVELAQDLMVMLYETGDRMVGRLDRMVAQQSQTEVQLGHLTQKVNGLLQPQRTTTQVLYSNPTIPVNLPVVPITNDWGDTTGYAPKSPDDWDEPGY